jgi:TolA-binding protein
MKRSHEVSIVKNKISIETMTKEVEAAKKMKFNEVTELQEVLTNHMEGTADSANQIDQLRMDIAEANVHIEQMTLSERELKKSLQEALDERNNAMLVKNEAISSYEIKLTVSFYQCATERLGDSLI